MVHFVTEKQHYLSTDTQNIKVGYVDTDGRFCTGILTDSPGGCVMRMRMIYKEIMPNDHFVYSACFERKTLQMSVRPKRFPNPEQKTEHRFILT